MSKPNKDRYAKSAPPIGSLDYRNALRSQRLQPPLTGIFDEPTRCYKLNLEWASHIEGAIDVLAEWTAWLGEDDERNIAVQQIREFLKGSNCVDCNEVNDCIESNPTFIAFTGVTFTTLEQQAQDHIDDLLATYDGSPQSIGSNIPTGAPAYAEKIPLCHAIGAWIRLYCEAKSAKIRQASQLAIAWNSLQDAMVDAYQTANSWLGFILPTDLFSCFVDFDEALTALADTQAIEDLQCCIYDEISTLVLTETAITTAIDTCASTLSGNAQKIACLLSNEDTTQNLLSFYEAYSRALAAQVTGASLNCPCEPAYYSYIEYDFTLSNHGFVATPHGTYVAGVGWQGVDVDPSPTGVRHWCDIEKSLTGDLPQVYGVSFHYERQGGDGSGDNRIETNWAGDDDAVGYGSNFACTTCTYMRTVAEPNFVTAHTLGLFNRVTGPAVNNPEGTIVKARFWIRPTSTIKGVPFENPPPDNDTNFVSDSPTFWA